MDLNAIFVPTAYWRLVRDNGNYRRLWVAQIVSEIGDWLYCVAIYSLLLELTGKASSVALALVLQVLPQSFTGVIAGVVNDRLSRKRVMIAADLARMFIVLGMMFAGMRGKAWPIYPLLFLETVMWAFFEPARNSVLPNITRPDQLTTANTLSSTTWSVNLAVGSGLGGVIGLLLGRNWIFIINAASFLASALLLARMHFREPHLAKSAPMRVGDIFDLKPIGEGLRYIRADFRRMITVFAKSGTAILGTSWVLFPVMGEKLFPLLNSHGQGRGMLAMSLLMSARGVGALVGPLLTAGWVRQDEHRLRRSILHGFLIGGFGYLALSIAPTLALAFLAVVLAHAGGSNVWVHSTTLLQLRTDDAFRGRVFSAELGIATAGMAAVVSIAGFALDYGASTRLIAAATGIAMFLPAALWAAFARRESSVTSAVRGTGAQS